MSIELKPETFKEALKLHGSLLMRFNSLESKEIEFWGFEEQSGITIHLHGKIVGSPMIEHSMTLKELDAKAAGIEFTKMIIRYSDRTEIIIKD